MPAAVSFIPSFHHSMERPWNDGKRTMEWNFIPSVRMCRSVEWTERLCERKTLIPSFRELSADGRTEVTHGA